MSFILIYVQLLLKDKTMQVILAESNFYISFFFVLITYAIISYYSK